MNKKTVICISDVLGYSDEIVIGHTYIMDVLTLWSLMDGTWCADILTTEGRKIGSVDIAHFREV